MKALCSAVILLISLFDITAQEENGYFQQTVDYHIEVSLDDVEHVLHGVMDLTYTNNSPVPLSEIYFHLWPNAYADVSTPMAAQLRELKDFYFQFSSTAERGFIDSLSFSVDGVEVEFQISDTSSEVVRVPLGIPIATGQKVKVRTPFRVKIPSAEFSRLGHIGTSYQITQWYPKPVVFDQNGWHPMAYLNQGEFYSEFGSFEVDITLPANYVIGATGRMDLSTFEALLSQVQEPSRDFSRKYNSFPPSLPYTTTHHYEQDSIHDFAWFADKRFNVLHDTIVLPNSGRVINAWVLYTHSHSDIWQKSMDFVKEGTRFFSERVGEYPYDHVTVVDGTIAAGGGMEYPMITVISSTGSERELERVIVHEIGHNWFYGMLGSNEREDAWMDEGINTYYEVRYFEEKHRGNRWGVKKGLSGVIPVNSDLNHLGYLLTAREHLDQGLNICSHRYTTVNYGLIVYAKASLLIKYLHGVLGDSVFDSAMREYFEQWRFKHPSPDDLRRSLEGASGEDLSWLFDDLINGRKKIDFKVQEYEASTGMVTIGSKTSFNGPVPVGFFKDGQLLGITNMVSGKATPSGYDDIDEIHIDPFGDVPELNRKNNQYQVKGVFKRHPGFSLKGLTRSGLEEKQSIFLNPMITWNDLDRWMVGLNLTNYELVAKDFEWTVSPMYSFSSERVVGYARGRLTIWMGEESPNRLTVVAEGRRYSTINSQETSGFYSVFKPSVTYTLIPSSLKDGTFEWAYTAHIINEELGTAEEYVSHNEIYHTLDYIYELDRGLFSTSLDLELEGHRDFFKPSLSLTNRAVYNRNGKQISVRLFGAKLWKEEGAFIGSAVLGLSGQSGRQSLFNGDYRYDFLFLGRSATEGLLLQQHVRNRGGFSLDSSIGTSDDWVASAGIEIELPLPLDISAYGNGGLYRKKVVTLGDTYYETEGVCEGGLRVSALSGLLDVSVPLVYSNFVRDIFVQGDVDFGERIRFQLRLEKLILRDITFDTIF